MAKQLNPGDKAPDFTAPTDGGGEVSLSDFKGKPVVLYFYPKDDTPGCTKEAIGFSESAKAFAKLGVTVIGCSKDTAAAHDKFKQKYGLGITLASDGDLKICTAYGTWIEKSMYGRKYMGIERSTFLIGIDGKLKQVWRKVKIPGHVEEVLAAAKAL